MEISQCIAKLQTAFNKPLPGYDAQQIMSPLHRKSSAFYLEKNPAYKTGCVLLLLYPDADLQTNLIMIERSDESATHAGQISFPGGKREMDDVTLTDVALRETYEEIGVDPSTIKVLGELSELYIPVSNFLVHPFVGFVNSVPDFKLSTLEVKGVLTLKLDFFLAHKSFTTFDFTSYDGQTIKAPYYPYQNYKIWGASAMMISELCTLIK